MNFEAFTPICCDSEVVEEENSLLNKNGNIANFLKTIKVNPGGPMPQLMSALDAIKQYTTIVADTGDFEAIIKFKPQDATTNPSLLLAAAQLPQYSSIVEKSISAASDQSSNPDEIAKKALEHLTVNFGAEILKTVPGRVSSEVPAALSYDTEGTVKEALEIISLYKKSGIEKDRVLIKIASTWEGIQAAAILERDHGIHCNLTLLFNLAQAIACAEANVTLISPFVGRILDWYKRTTGKDYESSNDPGVASVKTIYEYYKKFDYKTVIMGASFRNTGEIEELSGIDFLTISPTLLDQLSQSTKHIERNLTPSKAKESNIEKIDMTKERFVQMMADDPMATELLSEGIKKFDQDSQKLLHWLKDKVAQQSN